MTPYSEELEAARRAARRAGEIILGHYRSASYKVGSKGRNNPVTSADLEANDAISGILRSRFPGYGWLSEETADNRERLEKERVWIVDPLDGTKEFINRVSEFCVAIALAD